MHAGASFRPRRGCLSAVGCVLTLPRLCAAHLLSVSPGVWLSLTVTLHRHPGADPTSISPAPPGVEPSFTPAWCGRHPCLQMEQSVNGLPERGAPFLCFLGNLPGPGHAGHVSSREPGLPSTLFSGPALYALLTVVHTASCLLLLCSHDCVSSLGATRTSPGAVSSTTECPALVNGLMVDI